jgi:diphosphomevalonate decarboxylase
MSDLSATAVACANIAFIKYWGDRDSNLHIPANGSISMNLEGLESRTQVTFDSSLSSDQLVLNRESQSGSILQRVSDFMDRVRSQAGTNTFATIKSSNNFPMGTGIASSASGFAALSLAASKAAGLELSELELSRLARLGSGSACRSIPEGFVEWQAGKNDQDSYAYSIAPPSHWRLVDCIAIVDESHKSTGSRGGHSLADTSIFQAARVSEAPKRLEQCRRAIINRDFEALAEITELDSNQMHAVMMTSTPKLFYWQPTTLAIMGAVQSWRRSGIPAFFTIDAGPNVHVICQDGFENQVTGKLNQIQGIHKVITTHPGGPTRLEFR